jgi:TnpA family transposase
MDIPLESIGMAACDPKGHDTVHADPQGQSLPVFALAHLLGIKLMPRIRYWKDFKFFRPSKGAIYKHSDPLFDNEVNWELLDTHWQEILPVVLSIKAGKVLPSTLLGRWATTAIRIACIRPSVNLAG